MDRSKLKLLSISGGLGIAFSGIGYLYYKHVPKMRLKKYTELCLYIAVMDDEICRNEVEGIVINGREVIFSPKQESLQDRYHLFLEMYKTYSRKRLEKEVAKFEHRLDESRQGHRE